MKHVLPSIVFTCAIGLIIGSLCFAWVRCIKGRDHSSARRLVLWIFGVVVFGMLAGPIASFFVQQDKTAEGFIIRLNIPISVLFGVVGAIVGVIFTKWAPPPEPPWDKDLDEPQPVTPRPSDSADWWKGSRS